MYWLTGLLGIVLVFAPFVFGYSDNIPALWTSLIVGLGTVIASWWEGAQGNAERWEYWAVGLLGSVAVVAPFLFGFSSHTIAMWTSVVTGVLIAVFAGSKLFSGGFRNT